jgi:hypothetical protein
VAAFGGLIALLTAAEAVDQLFRITAVKPTFAASDHLT